MKNLNTSLHYQNDSVTSLAEIKKLANELLNTDWVISIYRNRESQVINLADLGWKFDFNDRKGSAGLCAPAKKTIYISKWLLLQNLHKALEFENTLRHEIAHAIDYKMRNTSDHGPIWKAIARNVLCTAERCYSSAQIAITETTKYTLICPSCDNKYPAHKKSKKSKACAKCCNTHNFGRFSSKYVFIVKQNY